MDIKKFKQEIKNEKLEIPKMSEEVKSESKEIVKENKKVKIYYNFKPIIKKALIFAPIFILVLIVAIIGIDEASERVERKVNNSYELLTVKDESHFNRILNYENKSISDIFDFDFGFAKDDSFNNAPEDTGPSFDNNEENDARPGGSNDYSETNEQEQGVSEADIVKTDGNQIFYLNKKDCLIYVYNVLTEEIKTIIPYTLVNNSHYYYNNTQMFLTEKYLVVLADYSCEQKYIDSNDNHIYKFSEVVEIIIYDKTNLEIVKKYKNDGVYISSRVTNNTLYLIYNQRNIKELPNDYIDGEINEYDYNDISYTRQLVNEGYTFIVAIDLESLELSTKVQLGCNSWTTIYVTQETLYLASTLSKNQISEYTMNGLRYSTSSRETTILCYSLNKINVEFKGLIVSSGSIRNQFYLDEYDDTLRVVLEQQNSSMGNNKLEIYDLNSKEEDGTIKKISSIDEGIGKQGEQVKSVKFDDNSCLIVTYLETDPLYYIDLTDKLNPQIIAGYEEPGYNTYLHYLDNNLALGFGYNIGYKMGLYTLEDGIPNKVDEINYDYIRVVANHKALYIEGNVFGFGGYLYSDEYIDEYGYYTTGIKYVYDVYTIEAYEDTFKFKLLKSFEGPFERMVRVKENYYLFGIDGMIKCDNNYEQISKIQFNQ